MATVINLKSELSTSHLYLSWAFFMLEELSLWGLLLVLARVLGCSRCWLTFRLLFEDWELLEVGEEWTSSTMGLAVPLRLGEGFCSVEVGVNDGRASKELRKGLGVVIPCSGVSSIIWLTDVSSWVIIL